MLIPTIEYTDAPLLTDTTPHSPSSTESDHPGTLADIHQGDVNIAIWRRTLPAELHTDVKKLLCSDQAFEVSSKVSRLNCLTELQQALPLIGNCNALAEDIAQLVDLFCQLLNRQEVRLRLTTVDRVMCPRFHVDNVPCRLVTTFSGPGTQWLHHDAVDRSKLGKGNKGLPDELSGIYHSIEDIQQLKNGDVALMKGARWIGNRQIGLVHRSPSPEPGEVRLLLTLDYLS